MQQTIETRELLAFEDGLDRATYHKPPSAAPPSDPISSDPIHRDRIGVVFLNSLSPSRAANGDSAVYWADSFAQSGYPSFRLDLAGYGDAAGDPPPELLKFINTGGYAALAAARIAELAARFDLSGVVVVGLCAGAVSALFAAAACPQCKGLVLMDPYFYLPLKNRSKLWDKLTGRISRSDLGRLVGKVYDRLAAVRVRLLGSMPPKNANFPLLKRWQELASAGLPILIFHAPSAKLRRGEFDYRRYILATAGSANQVVIKVIEGASHTFSNMVGRAAVRRHTESWLSNYFPAVEREEVAIATLRSESNDNQSYSQRPEGCLHG